MSVAQSIYPFGLGPGPLRFMNGIGEKNYGSKIELLVIYSSAVFHIHPRLTQV